MTVTPEERRALLRGVDRLRDEFGDRLIAVWLYGSRARGEAPREWSDVDLRIDAELHSAAQRAQKDREKADYDAITPPDELVEKTLLTVEPLIDAVAALYPE